MQRHTYADTVSGSHTHTVVCEQLGSAMSVNTSLQQLYEAASIMCKGLNLKINLVSHLRHDDWRNMLSHKAYNILTSDSVSEHIKSKCWQLVQSIVLLLAGRSYVLTKYRNLWIHSSLYIYIFAPIYIYAILLRCFEIPKFYL